MSDEVTNDDFPVCPYCGFVDRDPQEIEKDSSVQECGGCESRYRCERTISVTFTTTKISGN